MIYSTQHNKNTNEDPKTSVVFENLMLLPDNVFWSILKDAAANKDILPDNAGLLNDYYFWPKWNPNSKYDTGNTNFVEPDVFFRFEKIDVIVEAKYSDYVGQFRDEWEREFKAYLNEYESDRKKVVLLAVGGNSTFIQEPMIIVDNYKCPIVKYSWLSLLDAVLEFDKKELQNVQNDQLSSMKRIIRNLELGFQNIGINKYNKKVELKGLSNLFILGKVFQKAINRETESYTLSYYRESINSIHYGYQFVVTPTDGRRKPIWLTIAIWINEQETIAISARNDEWTGRLCKMIDRGEKFSSKLANKPYDGEDTYYYFEANEKFHKAFNDAETFDAQVALISKLIDDVCIYYLK